MKTTYIRGRGDEMIPIPDLEERLHARRRALFRQVADTEDDLRALADNLDPEPEEHGQEENIARLLARLDDAGKAEIEAIDRALAAVVSGDYGRCVSCQKPIPAARLEALPWAAECLPCAKAKELPR